MSNGKNFDYDYYDTGYVKSITYPNGLKTSYEYDNINRITKVITTKNGSAINTFEYEYDSNGNTTKEIRNGAVTAYSYDELDRLISVIYSDGSSVAYEYDALNNRTKETYSNGDVKDYVYDKKYQLQEIKLNGQTTDTFTYNESGAVVSHNDETYTYDEWDRMSGYSNGTDTYTYKYDANGIRTQKNDKQYIIDINNNVVAETDSTGAITDEILWGHNALARKTNGTWYYYIYNAHGDVVGLVNDSGTVVNTYEYTPWGEIRNETETVDNPIKYAGEYYDDELDMIYLRARYYDPATSRMLSEDPIKQGLNWYVYCNNNPLKYIDPSGLYYLEKDNNGQVYAVIQSGDTLSGIALSEVGNANAWTKMNYAGEPSKIQVGQRINISGIYDKAHPISIALANSLPLSGKPNSTGKIYNPDGSVKQEREYGPDGQPVKDRDYNHGGANHEFPHEHEWKDGVRGPAQPVPSEFSWGAALLGGLITIVEFAGYYYGVPVDLPGN